MENSACAKSNWGGKIRRTRVALPVAWQFDGAKHSHHNNMTIGQRREIETWSACCPLTNNMHPSTRIKRLIVR